MTVYLFFDESGNLDFSTGGTKYYCFGTLATRDPVSMSHPLNKLRYELLGNGVELEYFHAAEDRQLIRDRVFEIIKTIGGFEFDAVIVEKRKANSALHDEVRFYPQFAAHLLKHVFARFNDASERIILVTDRLPVKRKRQAVEKAFKTFIKQNLGDRPFTIVHHSAAGHPCLQAADYCMWAVYKKWSVRELRPYEIIKPFLKSEVDIFEHGNEFFY